MGAGHRQHMPALQQVFGQPLRSAGVGRARIEDGLHQRIARRAVGQARARDHVADHPDVGIERKLIRAEALDQIDAERAQLVAHGRVDARVATGDLMTGFAGQCGQASHERAADAEDVDVHAADYRGFGMIAAGAAHCYGEAFAQLHLPELAGGRAGHGFDELIALRQLPLGESVLQQVGLELLGASRSARA